MGTAGACPGAGQMCRQAMRVGFFVPGRGAPHPFPPPGWVYAYERVPYQGRGMLEGTVGGGAHSLPFPCRSFLTPVSISPAPQVSLSLCCRWSDSGSPSDS